MTYTSTDSLTQTKLNIMKLKPSLSAIMPSSQETDCAYSR